MPKPVFFLKKRNVSGLNPATLLEKWLIHRHFPVKLMKFFLITTFFTEHVQGASSKIRTKSMHPAGIYPYTFLLKNTL